MRLVRDLAAGLALACVAAGPARAAADEAVRDVLQPGAEGVALTVLRGNEIEEIPLHYLGTYDDFGGPGFDLHLVELEGAAAEHVGIANGMSGSPVYIGGKLVGALAFRLGALPKRPVAGVTPIEQMLSAARAGGPASSGSSAGLEPIATPVVVGGMPEDVRRWLAPEMEPLGFVLVPGGTGSSGEMAPRALVPGSPVGVELVRGDMRIAATGTVTLVDGDRVFAFGHPFLGIGRVEMPMVAAEVVHTLADLAGSLKLANIGPELGAIVEDRQGAVVGRLGQRAAMAPVAVVLRGGDYGERRFDFEMIPHPRLAPLLAAAAVASSLRSAGYSQEATLLARGRLRLRAGPELPLEMAYSSAGGGDPTLALSTELLLTLSALGAHPGAELRIAGLELEVDASLEPIAYTVVDVHYDRGALRPGQSLHVRCVLRRHQGGTEVRELDVPLPANIPDRKALDLVVGSPSAVDQALGSPLLARLRSAVDAEALVRIFDERRSAHRLTAVVYRAGDAVIARGNSYAELPPTAVRLLDTGVDADSSRRGSQTSPLGRAEVELDGPLRGATRVRLRVDRKDGGGDD